MRTLRSKAGVWLMAVLVAQGAVFYAIASRREVTPPFAPLSGFPPAFAGWTLARDEPVSKEVADVLRADDKLNRVYAQPATNSAAYLFVAYFRTQRTGASPHSPKNCLPGAGWEPVESPGSLPIRVEGRSAPIVVNRFVVANGERQSVVLYWYEGHGRVIASEFEAKFWLIVDSIRFRRSDTALVRVVVPVSGGDSRPAVRTAVEFVQAAYPSIRAQLPL